jgi:chromosome segregation ATPase
MKADEIRNTLKPMADFAPAILRAAEIVEAAEAADKQLATLDKTIAEKKKQIDALDKETQRQENLSKMATQNYTKARDDADLKLAQVEATLKDARLSAEKAIVGLNANVDKKRAELTALNKEIEAEKQRLAKAQQSLKEWAEKNSLKVA